VHTLEVVWTVDLAAAGRLDSLRDRLIHGVVWRDPKALVTARNDVAYTPNSPRARTELATALAEIGETDEALALHAALVAERPDDPDRWVDLFRSVALGGVPESTQEALWREALAKAPTSRVLVEVIDALDELGRDEEATGLADAAWTARPGDRLVRRVRRRRDLSIELDPTGTPWDDRFVLGTLDPRTAEVQEALRAQPLSLEVAQERGAQRAEESAAVMATICAAVADGRADDAWTGLLWLRDGTLPGPESDIPAAVVDELRFGAKWLPDEVSACLPDEAHTLLDPAAAPTRPY